MTIALLGASGFVGRHVAAQLEARGAAVERLPGVRIELRAGAKGRARGDARGEAESAAGAFCGTEAFRTLVRRMEGCAAVVNAAGLALPGGRDLGVLLGANTAVPIMLLEAARQAGVPRFVHVSSAAVQGRRDPLDETPEVEPLTPYGLSKALGEQAISGRTAGGAGPAVIVYRATSVQGPGRGMTKAIARLASLPLLPVARDADRPLPLALAENCGAAVAHLAIDPRAAGGIYLHPWEGVTIRTFLSALGVHPFPVPLLGPAARLSTAIAARAVGPSPRLTALLRNAELFFLGQGLHAERLAQIGFTPPIGLDGYRALVVQ